jgi:hypothetical protein
MITEGNKQKRQGQLTLPFSWMMFVWVTSLTFFLPPKALGITF